MCKRWRGAGRWWGCGLASFETALRRSTPELNQRFVLLQALFDAGLSRYGPELRVDRRAVAGPPPQTRCRPRRRRALGISSDDSPVAMPVLHANEESVIAPHTLVTAST